VAERKGRPDAQRAAPSRILGVPRGRQGLLLGVVQVGAGSFYPATSRRLKGSRIFKHYFSGCPFVAISGLKNLQFVMNREFETTDGIASAMHLNELMGQSRMAAERSKDRHQFLRRLVGQALTPSAVTSSLPVLERMAIDRIRQMERSGSKDGTSVILMEQVVTNYGLDVARNQILGLDLSERERPTFDTAVRDWIAGVVSARTYTGYKVDESKGYAALRYLEGRIGEKIDDLKRNGPDGASTLSGMVLTFRHLAPMSDESYRDRR
jgi:cytochrome P450